MDKKALSERDICTKFITPAIAKGGWDVLLQVRENVPLTKGRVIVRGKIVTRGTMKFADYVLYAKPNANIPLARDLVTQRQTVRIIKALLKQCDDLEAKLRRAEARASKLVEAVVQEMVA